MKKLLIFLLLAMLLSGCSQGSSRAGCTFSGDTCISITVDEPVRSNEPFNLTISVTSSTAVPDAKIYLLPDPNVLIEENGEWVSHLNWDVEILANQANDHINSLIFSGGNGVYQINVELVSSEFHLITYLQILQSDEGIKVYYPGTPIPHTPGPYKGYTMSEDQRATSRAWSTTTVYPSRTPVPTTAVPTVVLQSTPYPPPPTTLPPYP